MERGIVLLDKPSGPTSRAAAERVRVLLGGSKVGHGGTLDPKVTGLLPVLLGRSTKVAGLFLGSDKTYEGTMQLHGDVADEELVHAMQGFLGVIEQLPPRRSRVKRRVRRRRVYRFEVLARAGRRIEFSVSCEGGTYVRKLVHDLGEALGSGAHMAGLRRTRSGHFEVSESVTLGQLEQATGQSGPPGGAIDLVLPVEEAVARLLPLVVMDDGAVHSVGTGYPLAVPGVCELDDFEAGDTVALMTVRGELVGTGEALLASGAVAAAKKGFAVKPKNVLIDPDDYPKSLLKND